MQAMVLAVPITEQVPTLATSWLFTCAISCASIWSPRKLAQNRRQSVHAPTRSPRFEPVSIEPVTSWIAGTPAEIAPISSAGTVLSQPPISTTASIGWARTISSTSIDIRLRRYMLVGWAKLSWIEMVGKSIGIPPASITPRLTASTSCGALPWQGLKPLPVLTMPTTWRDSASSV